jgi:hypothetical protein
MLLSDLQQALQSIYEIETRYRVQDYVIHDPALAAVLDQSANNRAIPEKLLICERDGDLHLSLYLDSRLIDCLQTAGPTFHADDPDIVDFWTVLEGVSHFLYVIHRAEFDHEFSLLELELQAEIDKFVIASHLSPKPRRSSLWSLYDRLYGEWTLDAQLEPHENERYYLASTLAARYARNYARRQLAGEHPGKIKNELCRFYRLSHHQKLRAIQTLPLH